MRCCIRRIVLFPMVVTVFLMMSTGKSATVANDGVKVVVNSGTIICITGGTDGDFINRASGANHGECALQGELRLEGDWYNYDNGSQVFTSGSTGNVLFNGLNQSISGQTTFPNMIKQVVSPAVLTFLQGSTNRTTVTGLMRLQGTAGNLLSIRSDIDGSPFEIDPQGTRDVAYLDVKDSNNVNATAVNAAGTGCVDSGNNTNWLFVSVHMITASAGPNGQISPSGSVYVADGGNQTFTITPDTGYMVADVSVDSVSQGALSNYAFTNITADHAINATFVEEPNKPPTIDAPSDMTLGESSSTQTVTLTGITDGDDGKDLPLTVSATSDNHALISPPVVDYTSPNTTGTLTFTPVTDQSGKALITVTVMDTGGVANGGRDTTQVQFYVYVLNNTDLLKDINPGVDGAEIQYITAVADKIFFRANDGVHGAELWRSNGTVEGSVLVKDINPGANGSFPYELTDVNGVVCFSANDGSSGYEPWRSDALNTEMIRDLIPGPESSSPYNLTNVNGILYFAATDQSLNDGLWTSLGDSDNTYRLQTFMTAQGKQHYPTSFVGYQNSLIFCGDNGENGPELWRCNGTSESTQMIKDIYPGLNGSLPVEPVVFRDLIFVNAIDPDAGRSLWVSDGTEEGTQLLKKINANGDSFPYNFTVSGNVLFFCAKRADFGVELWRTDGTKAGTGLVKDINLGAGDSFPEDLMAIDGLLYFSADDGQHGRELWKTDGTPDGTALVKDINPGKEGCEPTQLTRIQDKVCFSAYTPGYGDELWTSDGSVAGTRLLSDILPGPDSSTPEQLTNMNDELYFVANDGTHGRELWKYSPQLPPDDTVIVNLQSDPAEAGRISPDGHRMLGVKTGKWITATPEAGYVFVKWEKTGNVLISSLSSATTKITPYTSGTVTAKFARETETVELTVRNYPVFGGRTNQAGTFRILKGEKLDLKASPNPGYVFAGWSMSPDGRSSFSNCRTGSTRLELNSSGTVTANYLSVTETDVTPKLIISCRTDKENSDRITVRNMPLPESMIADFQLPASVEFSVDGHLFRTDDDGTWRTSQRSYRYDSPVNAAEGIDLVLDLAKKTWSCKVRNTSLPDLDSSDGIDIILNINGRTSGVNLRTSQKTKWHYDSAACDQRSLPVTSRALAGFSVSHARGTFKSDQKNVSSGQSKVDGTMSSDSSDKVSGEIVLNINEALVTIGSEALRKVGSGNRFIYESPSRSIKLLVDFDKGTWTVTARNQDVVNPLPKVDVYLKIDNREGAAETGVIHTTILKN